MNIAFCDDDKFLSKFICENVKKLIDKYNQYNFSFQYFIYNDATEFLQDYKNKMFDIVFLDIEMPKISGLSIGDQIFSINNDVFIFYVTCYDIYETESIKHRVYRFVKKDNITELESGIKHLFNDLVSLHSRYIFTFKNSAYNLSTNSIFYCESIRNKVIIHTDNKSYEQIISIKKILDELPRNFCRCHSSFIVNARKIEQVNDKNLVLSNNVEISLGRKYKMDVLWHMGSIY